MSDVDFCYKLYDDIIKAHSDTSAYRITIDDDNSYKATIEYIPVGFYELIANIKALGSISQYVRLSLNNHLFKIKIEVYVRDSGEGSLTLRVYSGLRTVYYNLSRDKWSLLDGITERKIIFYSRNDVYTIIGSEVGCYPTNFKDLRRYPQKLVSVLLPYFTDTYIWKDFVKDEFFPPVKLDELCLYHNKKEYLERTFSTSLPKSINKLPLKQSYAICCAIKYVSPEQQQFILSTAFDFDENYNIDKRKRKSIAATYLKSFLSARFTKIDHCVIDDYVDFSLQQGKLVNVLAGKRKIVSLHDELAEEIMRKSYKHCKISIPNTPLKHLNLPKEFVMLKTQKALTLESKINHNCVCAYGDMITSGKCVIYSANIQSEHLTIDIRFKKTKNGYKFYISQCYKAYNQRCSEYALAYVNECLDNCSEKAINAYLKSERECG